MQRLVPWSPLRASSTPKEENYTFLAPSCRKALDHTKHSAAQRVEIWGAEQVPRVFKLHIPAQVSSVTGEVLLEVVRLYALNRIEAELAWLMAEELLPISAGRAVPELVR